jgi:phage baseplate assembly protein W
MIYGESVNIDSPTFRRLTDDTRILAQALEMRLSTRRGTYFDDPEYGLDLEDFLLDGVTPARVARLGAEIGQEIEKEERVESASVTSTSTGEKLAFSAEVKPSSGPTFSLTISIQDLSVEVLLRGA